VGGPAGLIMTARYFFHLEDGIVLRDEHGTVLKSLAAAKEAAVQLIAETLRNDAGRFWKSDVYRVTVTDAKNLILFSVELTSTLAPAIGATNGLSQIVPPSRALPAVSEHGERAKEMMRRAMAAFDEEERQEYLRLAAAWTTLAKGAQDFEHELNVLVPFAERDPNPFAADEDQG
jgi:hypothetical protein